MANKKKKKNLNKEAVEEVKIEPTVTEAAEASDDSLEKLSLTLVEAMKNAESTVPQNAEEIQPAEPEPVPKKPHAPSSHAYLAKMVAVLTVISMSIALLLSVVNGMTKDVIAANVEKTKNEAVLAVFPEGTDVQSFLNAGGEEIYIILKDGEILGCCVNAVAAGYAGDVSMMIGINTAGEICGIKIVSMSETPGVGTKISGGSFLEQFFGMSEPAEIGGNVDGISGATYSSRAVADGVNAALAVMVNYEEVAASIGASVSDANEDPEDNVNANEANGDEELNVGQAGESGAEDKPLEEPAPEENEPETPEVTEPEVTPEPEVPTAAEPEEPVVTEPEPVAEPEPQPEPEPEPVVVPEPQPEPEPEPVAEPEPQPEPEPEPVVEPEPQPEPEPEPVVEPEPQPEPEPEITPEPEEVMEEEIIEEPEEFPEPEPEPEPEETEEETEAPKKTIGGGFIKP